MKSKKQKLLDKIRELNPQTKKLKAGYLFYMKDVWAKKGRPLYKKTLCIGILFQNMLKKSKLVLLICVEMKKIILYI